MNLREQIESKIEDLKNEIFADEEEYSFFEFLENRISESKNLEDVSNEDYLLALIALEKHEKFDDLCSFFAIICGCLDKPRCGLDDDIVCLLTTIYGLQKINLLSNILKLDHEPSSKELDDIMKKYDEKVDGIIAGKKSPRLEMVACTIGYKTLGMAIFGDFNHLQTFAKYVSKCEDIDRKFTKFLNFRDCCEDYWFLKKNYSKLSHVEVMVDSDETRSVDDMIEPMDVSSDLRRISNHYSELSKRKKQFAKRITKQVTLYNNVLEMIDSLEEGKLANIKDEIFAKLDDSEIIIEFMKEILEHNRKAYSKLNLENIKKDKYHQIEKLFGENNIYIKEIAEPERSLLLKNGNIEILKEIIPYLKKEEFSWLNVTNPNYTQIILNTSPSILKTITDLIKRGVITTHFVMKYPEILISEIKISLSKDNIQPKYDLFAENILLLLQCTSNLTQKISKNESLVFIDTDELLSNIELSKKYELNLFSDNAKMYGLNILNDSKKFDILDQFIELGYADYMKQNSQLLREDSDDILIRLSIMSNVGIEPFNKEGRLKGSITNGKNFYVAKENLDNYRIIPINEYINNNDFTILDSKKRTSISEGTEKSQIVEYLDSLFKISNLEYQINDTIISRNKVLRNIECLLKNKDEYDEAEVILNSIIYHSVVDNSTVEFIKDKLSEYNKDAVKKKTYNI